MFEFLSALFYGQRPVKLMTFSSADVHFAHSTNQVQWNIVKLLVRLWLSLALKYSSSAFKQICASRNVTNHSFGKIYTTKPTLAALGGRGMCVARLA